MERGSSINAGVLADVDFLKNLLSLNAIEDIYRQTMLISV